jgi:hypothetical protein
MQQMTGKYSIGYCPSKFSEDNNKQLAIFKEKSNNLIHLFGKANTDEKYAECIKLVDDMIDGFELRIKMLHEKPDEPYDMYNNYVYVKQSDAASYKSHMVQLNDLVKAAKDASIVEINKLNDMKNNGGMINESICMAKMANIAKHLMRASSFVPQIKSMTRVCGTIEPPADVIRGLYRIPITKEDIESIIDGLIMNENMVKIYKLMVESI